MNSYPKTLMIVIFLLIASVICVATVYADVSYKADENALNDGDSNPENDIITVTMIPSVDSDYNYTEYTQSWINYCPFCHKYGTLTDTPKDPDRNGGYTNNGHGVPEGELTCDMSKGGCDADFCGITGKDKDGREVYLTPAGGSVPIIASDYYKMASSDFDIKFHCRASQISLINGRA